MKYFLAVIPAYAGIQFINYSWIPCRASLARNDRKVIATQPLCRNDKLRAD